jgi:hypothetical protein
MLSPYSNGPYSDQDSFSVSRIDEIIAHSKRIVEESLALSKKTLSTQHDINRSSFDANSSKSGSFRIDFNQVRGPNELQDDLISESRPFGTNLSDRFKMTFNESGLGMPETGPEKISDQETIRLENTAKNESNYSEEKRYCLSRNINESDKDSEDKEILSQMYLENKELKLKVKNLENLNFVNKSKNPGDSLIKAEIEKELNVLYKINQENNKEIAIEVQKIRAEIKAKELENQRKLKQLSSKLVDKSHDSPFPSDNTKSTPNKLNDKPIKNNENTNCPNCSDRWSRRCSNPRIETPSFKYIKKIQSLESELKKVKQKYRDLKKLYNKKCGRTFSIGSKAALLEKARALTKRKLSAKGTDRSVPNTKRALTPRITPR